MLNLSAIRSDYRVQVLDRTFAILAALADSKQLLGPTELGKKLNLNKSTVHRLLNVLEQHRFVERDLESSKYRLGLKLAELGNIAFPHIDFLEAAKPFVTQLAETTGEAAHLGVLSGDEIVSVLHSTRNCDIHAASTVGRRSPFHCTSLGKAILAFHADADDLIRVHRFIPFTRKTIRGSGEFRTELQKIRSRGLATDDEEFKEGLRCIGAPVRDGTDRVIAALSIAGPLSRITSRTSPHLAQAVIAAANRLSESMRGLSVNQGDRSSF